MGAEKTLYTKCWGVKPPRHWCAMFFFSYYYYYFFFKYIFILKKRIETPSCVLNQNGGDLDVCVGYTVCSIVWLPRMLYIYTIFGVSIMCERTVASISPWQRFYFSIIFKLYSKTFLMIRHQYFGNSFFFK